jgi:hypothetical protein
MKNRESWGIAAVLLVLISGGTSVITRHHFSVLEPACVAPQEWPSMHHCRQLTDAEEVDWSGNSLT